jgi:transcriptional regulator GlxA family with amidase domain
MQAHAEAVITVPDLCAAAHTSRRALQYAFEDLLQLSPISYLRCMRLNRVRRDLLRQPAAAVGDVAARWGFWHLSRCGRLPGLVRRAALGHAQRCAATLSRSDIPARAAA